MSEYEKQVDKTAGELSIFQAWRIRMEKSQIIFEGVRELHLHFNVRRAEEEVGGLRFVFEAEHRNWPRWSDRLTAP